MALTCSYCVAAEDIGLDGRQRRSILPPCLLSDAEYDSACEHIKSEAKQS